MSRPKVHLICNAHLDPVWQWRWEEGCAEALSTFATAVELLSEHDQLVFNHNESLLYRWVERYDPHLFSCIRELVAAGRWAISGGWFLQPDANLPGLESFVRHIAEGRRYFLQRFGVRPRVAYNFDSFGHHGGLPQILRQAGFELYVHMRPEKQDLFLPADVYRWQGVDGSEILTLRIAVGLYHTERDNILQRLNEGTELALKLNRDVPVFWGLGNHGGGATRADLKVIDSFVASESRVEVVHSTLERLLDCLQPYAKSAPVVAGDLQRVFPGCYTSLSRLKRRARTSLAELVQAETLCAAAWWQSKLDYPEEDLEAAWRDHLFNDFHDILPGTCTEPAERDALDLYGRVSQTARELKLDAAVALNRGANLDVELPFLVVNANPGTTRVPVEIEFMVDHRPLWSGLWHTKLFNSEGEEILAQEEQPAARLPFNGWRRKLVAMLDLPRVGAANWHVRRYEGLVERQVQPATMKHSVDSRSGLVDSLQTDSGQECLAGLLLEPLVAIDNGDSWGTDQWANRDIVGRFMLDGESRVTACGPVRSITESVLRYEASQIVLQTVAYCDWPVMEFRFLVRWNEPQRRLKLAIPTRFRHSQAECEIPGGMIQRPADGDQHVHGRWFLLASGSEANSAAIGVVNSGQHGIDCRDGCVELSVLRSAAYCHERGQLLDGLPATRFMDVGEHEFRLLVTVGRADEVRRRLSGLADWLDAAPGVFAHLRPAYDRRSKYIAVRSGGTRVGEETVGLLSIEPANVRLVACKKANDSEALIIRMHETIGQQTTAYVTLSGVSDKIELRLREFEIHTLLIERDGSWRTVNLIEEIEAKL
ncbi:MAG TPA: glycoside hydrolase family 38 C-terminal domain-containing protein [Pirellulaceae bacterium]|nr:glycoside hydrolase family 38 C-terminal domain-containing protein [Pirellulaceae bacterium]HMO90928.1 glycoside hydrolase family 38 C-terminal domain-containing protein [Pirellulaceae bacterium]HMP69827.1 glycoside hydrolase family 38 C-terminal domain-containing protein [Pirellulaceae bacterium]